ncbi:MAG: NAD(P)/FAD-dependent oxidoreductase [Pseudomonadota bacterium]
MNDLTQADMDRAAEAEARPRRAADPAQRDFDMIIIGAGMSGIGAAHNLLTRRPNESFAILEAKADYGGTWRTHTYPGIRSDSDFYTFGFGFKPWLGDPIAKADQILDYLSEAIEEDDLTGHIHYQRRVKKASWSTAEQRWTLQVENGATGEVEKYTTRFMWMCQGYYDHDNPYTPDWDGMGDFKGQIVHPQQWPDDLDYKGKRVVVIGSGATAATLIPSLAPDVGHVTMLQRSPTYFHPGFNKNELADQLRALEIPDAWTHEIVRRAYLKEQREIQELSIAYPEEAKKEMINVVKEHLGEDFDVETHFTPSYNPWRQRIAFVPDGDLFEAMKTGKASVVTDHIDRFVENGILLKSGKVLEADIIITATGFNLSFFGGIPFDMDGEPIDFADTVTYRGLMIEGVPNLSYIFGYLRTAWTMRVDLCCDFYCRLLDRMDERQAKVVVAQMTDEERALPRDRIIPESEFNSGYMQRGLHKFPKRVEQEPWNAPLDYYVERETIPSIDLDEPALKYS